MNADRGFWVAFGDSFRTEGIAYVVGGIFAVLAVFPAYFAEKIKSALNKANAREEKYAALATQLSGYIFDCELVIECLGPDLARARYFAGRIDDLRPLASQHLMHARVGSRSE